MTFTIESADIGKYNIDITQEKYSSAYRVRLNYSLGDYYKTEKENFYTTLAQAKRRFASLKKTVLERY